MSTVISPKNDSNVIIAIGASAGGLEALQLFLSHLTDLEKATVIIAQHLSPTHNSLLVQLLNRETRLDVLEAIHEDELKQGTVYITPPNKDIAIIKGKIHLSEPASKTGPKPSIDVLFKSIAKNSKYSNIGIILSGTGSDGAEGVRELSRKGGMIIVQEPKTAKYDGMPSAAIQTGLADAILSPSGIAEKVNYYLHNTNSQKPEKSKKNKTLKKIFEILSIRTGSDFSNYKSATIGRRLEKRITSLNLQSLEEYLNFLEKNPEEALEIFNTILIGVTSFFRDKKAFKVLDQSLQDLVAKKEKGDTIRIWIAGCSTGEEAYSIAILLNQLLRKNTLDFTLQIFATDIDERAIAFARKGVYPASSLENTTEEIRDQFFLKKGDNYEVKKAVRSMVLFSKHDLLKNPPFLKLDLISCRNLLIYFNSTLQQQVLPIFHYSLNNEGYLFLGQSETIGNFKNLFSEIKSKQKIYQRKRGSKRIFSKLGTFGSRPRQKPAKEKPAVEDIPTISGMVKETLFNTYEHPYVVVDDQYQILEVNGDVRLFLSLSPGTMQVNLFKMLNKELLIEARAALTQAIKNRISVKSDIKKFELFDTLHFVRITAKPLLYTKTSEELYIVIFEKLDIEGFLTTGTEERNETGNNFHVKELEKELLATKEQLQSYIEEIETSNEELQSLNEELHTTNEELQTSNEELETSNEELQSTNEEVQITYTELKAANDELERKEKLLKENKANIQALLNNDLQAFILLDTSYKVLAHNKKARTTFEFLRNKTLKIGDIMIDFIAPNQLESFIYDFDIAIKGEVFTVEKELYDLNGNAHWFTLNYTPVIVDKEHTRGISVSFLDISDHKKILSDLVAAEMLKKAIFNATSTGISITDEKGMLYDVNSEYCKIYGYERDEMIGKHFTFALPEEIRESFSKMHDSFMQGTSELPGEFQMINTSGESVTVSYSSELLIRPDGARYKVTSIKDITQHKDEEARLRLLESVVVNTSDAVLITEAEPLDSPGPRIVYVNEAFTKMTGYAAEEVLGKSPRILQGPKSDRSELKKLGESLRKWLPCEITTVNYKKNGEEFWINFTVTPVANELGWYTHWIAIERDVTKQKINELQKNLLSEITYLFNQNDALKKTLEAVLSSIVAFGDFGLAEIWLISSDREQINLVSSYSKTDKIKAFYDQASDFTFAKGQGLPGVVWNTKKREFWKNLEKNKKHTRLKAAGKTGIKSVYGLPLFYNEEIVGVMVVGIDKPEVSKNSYDLSLKSFEKFLGAEIKRKQLAEELNKIFNFSPDIICIAGFDGLFKRINPAGCEFLEYTEEELLKIPFVELTHPDDRIRFTKELENRENGRHVFYIENRLISKSGKVIWLAWTLNTDFGENVIYAVAKDITAKKEAEDSLEKMNVILGQRAKELAISNQELEQFAYVASHDLQEPLRTISSFLTQLEKKYDHALDEKAHQYINFAVDGAKRMREIIRDLLEFSRAGKNLEKKEQVDLNGVVDGILTLQRKILEEKNAEVNTEKLPVLLIHRHPITQIFQNLIGNALKYTVPEKSPRIEISCENHIDHWHFAVKDNGIGIEEEYFEKIFIIFQRLHSKEDYVGTGIGLSIVKKLVEGLGGKIWMESKHGEGSTFYFSVLKN